MPITINYLQEAGLLFFGAYREAGHYYWLSANGVPSRVWLDLHSSELPKWLRSIDGLFVPATSRKQSAMTLNHLDNATVLAFHDFSQDSRPGCNGAVIAFGELLDAATILSRFYRAFPEIFNRIEQAKPFHFAPSYGEG